MQNKMIKIQGARTHNLKDFDLELPRNKLVVITGFIRVLVNHHLLLIHFMQKVKGVM